MFDSQLRRQVEALTSSAPLLHAADILEQLNLTAVELRDLFAELHDVESMIENFGERNNFGRPTVSTTWSDAGHKFAYNLRGKNLVLQ